VPLRPGGHRSIAGGGLWRGFERSREMTNPWAGKRMLALGLVATVLLVPVAARADVTEIILLLRTITTTLQNSVGQVLGGIESINTTVRDFEQQVIWPVTLINQARASVQQVRAQFTSLAGQIHRIPTSSATLVNPSRLEGILRSRQAGNVGQIN